MDDLFTFFLIFVFFVLPVLERVLKGGRKKPPPTRAPQRRPQAQRPPQRRPLPEARQEREPARGAEEMVPDDLWAILTGERRPDRPAPPPARTPPPPLEWEGPAVEGAPRPDTGPEELAAERVEADRQLEDLLRRRRREGEAPPVVVSLESEPPPEARRHQRFHQRMDALAAPPSIRRKATVLPSLREPAQLKRAFVLQEVLGKPKGLE